LSIVPFSGLDVKIPSRHLGFPEPGGLSQLSPQRMGLESMSVPPPHASVSVPGKAVTFLQARNKAGTS